MPSVASSLKNRSAKFNSERLLEASGRLLSTWLGEAKNLPPSMQEDIKYTASFVQYAVDKLLTSSSNSSRPPSQDPNREKGHKKTKKRMPLVKRKPGGQKGHEGHYLEQVTNPDEIRFLEFEPGEIKEGWTLSGEVERRQVFNITFNRHVIEYQAQVCYDQQGKRHVAKFPKGVNSYVQYGNEARSFCANLQVYQMVPYKRTALFLNDVFNLPMSEGVLKTNLDRLYNVLEKKFVPWAKYQLITSPVIYTDETPINVSGKTCQAIIVSNGNVNFVNAFKSKSIQSIKEMGILPIYTGVVMSDCNAATLHFTNCTHILCGIHLLRDLTGCIEKEEMNWAKLFKKFILDIKEKVEENGILSNEEFDKELKHYSLLITKGYNEVEDKKESGMPVTKSAALLKRLVNRGKEYLLFAIYPNIPFDNMISERGIRMEKVHLKISGCYKSLDNANICCVIKSYIDTCRNYGIDPYTSLATAFNGEVPKFINLDGCDEDVLNLIKNYGKDNDDTSSNVDNEIKQESHDLSNSREENDCESNNSQSHNKACDEDMTCNNAKSQTENNFDRINNHNSNLRSIDVKNDKESSNKKEKDSFSIKNIVNKAKNLSSKVISTAKVIGTMLLTFIVN